MQEATLVGMGGMVAAIPDGFDECNESTMRTFLDIANINSLANRR
ncbi:MAG: hypothetical protein CSYNP_04362 [Syntrophus sp. SKADARSKE-3]|nr:hypothetical protein [Syntrophus sp. SKADARSKE-3]